MIIPLLCAYLLGSIPFGLVWSRLLLNVDIRTIGSGNIGATNVLRSGNKKVALLTLLCDGLKGACAVLIAFFLQKKGLDAGNPLLPLYAAMMAILGHVFPIWLKFRGGKGVATALGTLLPLHPPLFGIVCLVWLVFAKFFRVSSLSALSAFGIAPCAGYFFDLDVPFLVFLFGLFLLLLWTHRSNISRIMKGEEGKIEN